MASKDPADVRESTPRQSWAGPFWIVVGLSLVVYGAIVLAALSGLSVGPGPEPDAFTTMVTLVVGTWGVTLALLLVAALRRSLRWVVALLSGGVLAGAIGVGLVYAVFFQAVD